QRVAVLEYIRPTQRELSSDSVDSFRRYAFDFNELARLKAAIEEYKTIVARVDRLSDPRPRTRTFTTRARAICLVDAAAIEYCALESTLVDPYVAGYWNRSTYESVYLNDIRGYDLLKRIDDIYTR